MNVSKAIFEGRNRILGVPNVPISDPGRSDPNAKVSECFKKGVVDTNLVPLDDSPLSLTVYAKDKDQRTHKIDITSAAIERSPFLKRLTEEFPEEIKEGKKIVSLPHSAEALENYLNKIDQPLSNTLSGNELLDLIKIADYLEDDALIRDAIYMFERKIAEFTKENCFALIGSVQLYPQSGGIRKAEEHLMRRLSAIIKYDSDKEILNVFIDLARHLGDRVKSISILDLGGTKVSSETLKALAKLFPNVKELNISGTKVTKIPPGLWPGLETLNVSSCPLTSIKGLENTGIKKLNISETGVTEIPSGRWAGLKTLDASGCTSLVSIEGLENTGIKELDISGTGVTEIPSGSWKKLETLEAFWCKSLASIEVLKKTGIKKLNISYTDVTEIPSGRWAGLETLEAPMCTSLGSIEGLEKTGIKKLDISGTGVTEIPSGRWAGLETLKVPGCRSLASIEGLEKTGIKELDISYTNLTEIPSGPWRKLEKIDASFCESLTSIDALKETGITEIDISSSGVTISSDGWDKVNIISDNFSNRLFVPFDFVRF